MLCSTGTATILTANFSTN